MPDFAVKTAFVAQDKYSAAVDKMGDHVEKMGKKSHAAMEKASKSAEHFREIFSGAFASELAMKGLEKAGELLKELPKQIMEYADKGEEIGRTSKVIGMNAEAYQRLAYAAHITDTSAETLDKSLKKMNVGLEQLKKHQGPLESGLKRVNPQLMMQLRTATSSQEAFLMVADSVKRAGTAQERAAIATAVFGKAGQDMIPMLLEGKDGLADMMAEADKYGSVLSGSSIEASERFNDALKKTKGIMTGLKNVALGKLVEAAAPYIEKLQDWASANRELIATKIQEWTEKVIIGVKKAGLFIRDAYQWTKRAYEVAKPFLPIILKAAAGIFAFNKAKAGLDAVKMGFEFFKGVPGMLGPSLPLMLAISLAAMAISKNWDKFEPFITKISSIGGKVFKALDPVFAKMGPMLEKLAPVLEKIADVLANVLITALKALEPMIDGLNDVLNKALNKGPSEAEKGNKSASGQLEDKMNAGGIWKDDPIAKVATGITAKVVSNVAGLFDSERNNAKSLMDKGLADALKQKDAQSAAAFLRDFVGKNYASLQNNSDLITEYSNKLGSQYQAPNSASVNLQNNNRTQVTVDNSKAPGVTSKVRTAPIPAGDGGNQ